LELLFLDLLSSKNTALLRVEADKTRNHSRTFWIRFLIGRIFNFDTIRLNMKAFNATNVGQNSTLMR
jgi:hypothetical protein